MADSGPSKWLRAVFVLGGLAVLGLAAVWPSLPKRGPSRVEVGEALTGVNTGQSYAWVLKTEDGAVLVDAGGDAEGKALLQELSAQGLSPEDVHSILITHGHIDHWAGAHLFPNARVWVGPGETAILLGRVPLKSPVGRLTGLLPRPPVPTQLEAARDGEELDLDGEKVLALHVPGHTPGSMMYLWRDVLFTGDSLVHSNSGLAPAPFLMSESRAQNVASLRKLAEVPFTRTADGHSGVTDNAREALRGLLR
ncbi:MBL fold metallo-hydrolase [Stigmatella hybrida]|uniref:MBL fold metallo-hydrolase n=1 Tax=Stigmatella hybrida TaxID=394097 RepID=UPI001CDB3CDC|nr:MBL fold metallo-hydrolase [Stigmatella hybrida]